MSESRSAGQWIGLYSGVFAALVYMGWNIWWIVHGCIPPSMLLKIFGIPAPTTGMTRSWAHLFRGEIGQALLWNPLTLPVTILYGVSLAWLVYAVMLRRLKISLPSFMVRAWAVLLLVAWCIKLLQGPSWW